MPLPARPLPKFLVQRYKGWRATDYEENHSWYARLAEEGQRPRAMIISCCDSRVHVTAIFGAEMGEFFIHRNIANLVPPFKPDGDLHGTSAALEYAVMALRVSHILVLGHSQCGGVEGGYDMHCGEPSEVVAKTNFIGPWMDILDDAYDRIAGIEGREAQLRALEKEGVVVSLKNLLTFPFVAEGIEAGNLAVHGVWHDIGRGVLESYDPETEGFVTV